MARDKSIDVTALGELLIDFTQNGMSPQGNPLFEANPGGAPCNVLSMLTRLGHRTAFIGKVGDDMFGRMLRERAEAQGIDMSGLVTDRVVRTTLAFVQTFADGDRDFSFYRNPGADVMLTRDEVERNKELLEQARIFHFGTLSMTDETVERATKEALTIAKDNGALISFDPNLRPPLWKSEDMAREKIVFGLENCDILKISDNEIEFMTGTDDIDRGVRTLIDRFDIPLVFATLGKDGSKAFYSGRVVFEEGFANPDTIETTGAGDTFCACALHFVLKYGIRNLDDAHLHELLTFANAAASLITTRKGALCVMPQPEEVEAFIRESGRG
ncbi:MAG: carbohydrate kinase [Lachnospiraceae bacterium]|nr:carbohydrate kinase [Lachnospiraceae bacterium]